MAWLPGVLSAGQVSARHCPVVDKDGVTPGEAGPLCHCCGKPIPEGNLAWDYPVPDPVALLSEEDLAVRVVFRSQPIMSVRELGNFIYVILPVPVEFRGTSHGWVPRTTVRWLYDHRVLRMPPPGTRVWMGGLNTTDVRASAQAASLYAAAQVPVAQCVTFSVGCVLFQVFAT
jgi:hypothetical protein